MSRTQKIRFGQTLSTARSFWFSNIATPVCFWFCTISSAFESILAFLGWLLRLPLGSLLLGLPLGGLASGCLLGSLLLEADYLLLQLLALDQCVVTTGGFFLPDLDRGRRA